MAISYSIHHSFSTELAKKYGIEEAILIHHFQYWIAHNKNLNRNFKEGRTWSFQTIKEIQAWFPYMSPKSVLWTLNRLVELKILLKKNFNKNPIDKTSWYAFVDEDLFMGENSKNVYERQKRQSSDKNGKAIPDPITSDSKKEDPLLQRWEEDSIKNLKNSSLPLNGKRSQNKNPRALGINPKKLGTNPRSLQKKLQDISSELDKSIITKPPKPKSPLNLEAKLKETGRTNPKLLELALQKLKEQPLGDIKSPFSWLKKVYDNLLDQEKMNDLVEFRKRFVFAKKKSWLPGKDKVTVLSGSLETSYSYRGNEEFWVKHGLGMEDYLKHLEKIEKGKEE